MYLLCSFVLIEEKRPNVTPLLRRRRKMYCTVELQVEAKFHRRDPLKRAKNLYSKFGNLLKTDFNQK